MYYYILGFKYTSRCTYMLHASAYLLASFNAVFNWLALPSNIYNRDGGRSENKGGD